MNLLRLVVIGLMGISVLAVGVAMARRGEAPGERERTDKLFAAGNYKDAYEGYRRLALDAKAEPDRVGGDLTRAIQCLVQLGRVDEVDAFREAVIAVHRANWRLLQAAAESYLNDGEHYGFIVAGKFHRGQHRGGGRYVGSYERDRARALQLLVQGLDRARTDPDRAAAGRYLLTLARALMGDRATNDSWRLQTLTPLDVLPDYDENPYRYWGGQQAGGTRRARRHARLLPGPRELRQGEERRRALAMGARPGRRGRPRPAQHGPLRRWPVSSLGQFGTQTIAGRGVRRRIRPKAAPKPPAPMRSTPSPTTRRSPGWPPASSGSSSPTSSTRSRSTRRSPTIPKTGQDEEALDRAGVDLRESPPARPGRRVPRSGAARPTGTRTAARPGRSTRSSAPGASSSP